MIDPSWIAGLGVILFGVGLIGVFTRINAIVVLMCIEVMLNAANLNFVAGTMHYGDVNGWVFTAIAIAIAAAEVAIGLAIFLSLYSTQQTISLDDATTLRNCGMKMGESKNESGLLVFILPFLAVVPALYILEWESYEASILIVAIPFMTFPVILIAGQI